MPDVAEIAAGRCETCRFWDDDGDQKALCRRRPPYANGMFGPAAFSREPSDMGVWPVTEHTDWCGEWETRHGS